MQKPMELRVNYFQLDILFDKNEKKAFQYLLQEGVYCFRCNAICPKGVVDYTLRLDIWNNVVVNGKCAACGNQVVRVMEFGEDLTFFEKAMEFRKSLVN